jgi:simple sugar transport system permease protein
MAGLAGGLEVAGPLGQLTPHVPAGYGFAAIIVAFVGRLHPVGIVFSAILMSMFYIGGELAQSRLGLPKSLTGVFQGLLLFTLLACDTLIAYRIRRTGARTKAAILRSAQDDRSGDVILSAAKDLVPDTSKPAA